MSKLVDVVMVLMVINLSQYHLSVNSIVCNAGVKSTETVEIKKLTICGGLVLIL